MKKICYIGGSGGEKIYHNRLTGPQRLSHELALRLKDNYRIISIRPGKRDGKKKGEIIIRRGFFTPFKLFKKVTSIKPQIIHGYGSLNMAVVLCLLKFIFNKKTILTFTDFKKNLTKSFGILNHLDAVIVQTAYAEKRLLMEGVKQQKIHRILYGVEESFNSGKEYHELRRLNKKIVLYYGDARKERGFDLFLDAIKLVKKNISFLICLRSKYNNIDHKNLAGLKNNKKVKFLKIDDYPCPIQDIMKSSDVVVLPFLQNTLEPPLTLMETVTLGKPVITTNVGGNKEVVQNKDLIIKDFDPETLAKAIEEFFVKKPKAVKQKFNWIETIEKIKDIYNERK